MGSTNQNAVVDGERTARVSAARAAAAGTAGTQGRADDDVTESLRAHRVGDHLQGHVALGLVVGDASSCEHNVLSQVAPESSPSRSSDAPSEDISIHD